MLELKHISWSLPERSGILKDVSLTIPTGRLTVVTGPNGGGKTSLAKAIAGLIPGVEGSILLDGQDLTSQNVTERALAGISYGFQQPVRFKGITVRMLLELAAGRALGVDEICDLLGKVGLCTMDYIDREVNASLSGGEIKRVEIATVLARGTRVSIFDEPEAGIDIWSFNGLVNVFESMNDGTKTMVVISHQERILKIADDIVVMADGRVREHGPGREILPRLLEGEIAGHCPVGRN